MTTSQASQHWVSPFLAWPNAACDSQPGIHLWPVGRSTGSIQEQSRPVDQPTGRPKIKPTKKRNNRRRRSRRRRRRRRGSGREEGEEEEEGKKKKKKKRKRDPGRSGWSRIDGRGGGLWPRLPEGRKVRRGKTEKGKKRKKKRGEERGKKKRERKKKQGLEGVWDPAALRGDCRRWCSHGGDRRNGSKKTLGWGQETGEEQPRKKEEEEGKKRRSSPTDGPGMVSGECSRVPRSSTAIHGRRWGSPAAWHGDNARTRLGSKGNRESSTDLTGWSPEERREELGRRKKRRRRERGEFTAG